jgi:hypothetical protein
MRNLRAIPLTLALGSLLLPLGLSAPLVQQLKDGSFESWSQGTDGYGMPTMVPANWTVEIGQVAPSPLATSGNDSAELRALPNEVGGHFSQIAQTVPSTKTDLPIVPGAYYDFSFDALGSYQGKGLGNASVTWTGALGHTLRVDTIDIAQSTGFVSYSVHLQAPIDPLTGDAATSATIRFYVDGQSSDVGVNLLVDNAQFGPSAPA